MMIRALVFDFDGLILDTETPELIAWQETFSEHGTELTLETWIDCVGRPPGTFDPCVHLETVIGRQIDREAVRQATRARAHELIANETLRPGVTDWLDEADRLGLKLAVASSSSRSWVTRHLERFGIGRRFQAFVCYEDVERHKPDPEPYRRVTELLDVSPSQAVAVEDSANGLRAARAAGLWSVAVPNHVTRQSVADLGHLRIDSMSSLSLRQAIEELASRGFRP